MATGVAAAATGLPATPHHGLPHQSPPGIAAYNPAAAVAAAAYMTSGLPAAQFSQGMAFYGAGALPQAQTSQSALTSAYPGETLYWRTVIESAC